MNEVSKFILTLILLKFARLKSELATCKMDVRFFDFLNRLVP